MTAGPDWSPEARARDLEAVNAVMAPDTRGRRREIRETGLTGRRRSGRVKP